MLCILFNFVTHSSIPSKAKAIVEGKDAKGKQVVTEENESETED